MKERTERRYPLAREESAVSGVGRRRVCEDVRAKKERVDPGRAERRDAGELNARLRRRDQGRIRRVVIAPSRNQRNSARMIAAVCISMNARV